MKYDIRVQGSMKSDGKKSPVASSWSVEINGINVPAHLWKLEGYNVRFEYPVDNIAKSLKIPPNLN